MLYKALTSFSGIVSMAMGEIGEINDPAIAADLLKAGYIEKWVADEIPKKKRGKKNED